MSLVRLRSKSAALRAVFAAVAPAVLAASALFAVACRDEPGAQGSAQSVSGEGAKRGAASASASAAPSALLSSTPSSSPTESPSGAAAAPSSSALSDAPPTLSASAPPPEKAPATKPSASASAKASAGPKSPSDSAAKPPAGAADAGAPDAAAQAKSEPAPSATPAEKPIDLPPPVPGSPDAIAAQIDAVFVGKKTFSARFTQEFTQKVSGVVKKSTGTLFVEKPNKISFRYDAPNKNRIVSDGKELKIYVAEDAQMFVQPVAKTEYPGALAFLMGNGIRPSFTFTLNDKAKFDGGPVLLGKPRSPTPHYEYVMFYVEKALLDKADPNVVRRVLIVDAQGNKNRFDFEGASQPASISPSEFVFTPPEGTTITSDAKK